MTAISTVAATLLALGIPADAAAAVRLEALPEGQASLSVGYDKGGRRKVVAETLSSMDAALATLADRNRVAGLIALGVRAMPAAQRPSLPAWISQNPAVAAHDALRARVDAVAARAADQADLPWAA